MKTIKIDWKEVWELSKKHGAISGEDKLSLWVMAIFMFILLVIFPIFTWVL